MLIVSLLLLQMGLSAEAVSGDAAARDMSILSIVVGVQFCVDLSVHEQTVVYLEWSSSVLPL